MNSTHIISQDVFDKIRSRFQNLEMGDESGAVTTDPKEARFFDFDFMVEGENLGRVSISINERGTLKVFYSQGILEGTNDVIHHLWYDFLREMRMFAKRRLLRFDTRDITKSNLNKNDFQYLAANGPKDNDMNMNESVKFEGSKKTSYRVLEKTKLIAKHKHSIENEGHGARSRGNNIKALYIENSEGERFKYPFIHIAGAKAMQRHVANGGRPYDSKGEAIIKMSEEIMQLSAFKRHIGKPDGMNQKVNEITSKTNSKLEMLRRTVEGLSNQSYYEKWSEGYVPNTPAVELDQATMEDYKSAFTVSSFREDLAQYFPLIHRVMHEMSEIELDEYVSETNEEKCEECGLPESKCECPATEGVAGSLVGGVAGAIGTKSPSGAIAGAELGSDAEDTIKNIFTKTKSAAESIEDFVEWADRLEEGKLEPDTLAQLKELLDSGLTLDEAGRSAIDALQGIGIYDDELENALEELSKVNPDADPKDTILAWLAKDDPEAAQEFGFKQQGPDIGPGKTPQDGEQEMPAEGAGEGVMPSVREIAEMVYSFYDRETGKFPKGETGVVTHIKKELGDQAGTLAEKLVQTLSSRVEEGPAVDAYMAGKSPAIAHYADQLDKNAEQREQADMDKIPAYVRKQKQQSQQAADQATDKRNQNAGAKVWKNPRTNEEFDVILKLAGLAK